MKRRPSTGIAVEEKKDSLQSFKVTESGVFQKGNLRISRGGLKQQSGEQDIVFSLADLKIGEFLGRGASGNVRYALHPASGLKIALKDIDVYDEKRRQQLLPELTVLLRTKHPNLVRLYDAFFDQGKIYMALEFMDRGTLDTVRKQFTKIPETILASMMQQTFMGLAYLHEDCQQVHRDLKPENLLLNEEGFMKIGDFGISKQIGFDQRAGTFVGTTIYMSPERLNGESYSYPSDVWAIGIIALECAVGEHPYDAGVTSYFELLPKIMHGPEPLPPKEGFTPDFRDFVRMCVQKDPSNRPTADQMLQHPYILSNASEHPEHIVAEWLTSEGAVAPKIPQPQPALHPVVVNGEFHSLRESFKIKPDGPAAHVQRSKLQSVMEPVAEKTIEESRNLTEVRQFLERKGVSPVRLVFGIDFTKSNKFSGSNTFGDRPLHWIDPTGQQLNPYQYVIKVLGETLQPLHDDTAMHVFGFGDNVTKDTSCFSFFQNGVANGLDEVLSRYQEVIPTIAMSGGTNFAPVILEAIEIVKRTGGRYHILVIIADGIVTSKPETAAAVAEAAKYPLTIIVVGVGDGPFDAMFAMGDQMTLKEFSHLVFVQHHAVISENPDRPDASFAAECLKNIPEQWQKMKRLGVIR